MTENRRRAEIHVHGLEISLVWLGVNFAMLRGWNGGSTYQYSRREKIQLATRCVTSPAAEKNAVHSCVGMANVQVPPLADSSHRRCVYDLLSLKIW